MKRLVLSVIAFVWPVIGVVILQAEEKSFWDSKVYTEWTEKEVSRLLTNSPWSKAARITVAAGGRGSVITPSAGRPGSGSDVIKGGGSNQAPGGSAEGILTVYFSWYAKPVREALARNLQIQNPQAPVEALDQILKSGDPEFIDLFVAGWMPRFSPANAQAALSELQERTYLQKKNKDKIPAAAIQPPRGRERPLVLRFPRKQEGRDLFSSEDVEVDLFTKVEGNTVRVKFKLADMKVNGQPEW